MTDPWPRRVHQYFLVGYLLQPFVELFDVPFA
jgi:hypothetical protein